MQRYQQNYQSNWNVHRLTKLLNDIRSVINTRMTMMRWDLPFRSTWVHPRFLVGFVLLFSFMCMFCRSLFVLLYFFLLAIVLSVLLRYTDSDCHFGIFKLFLNNTQHMKIHTISRITPQRHFPVICVFAGNTRRAN